MPAVFREPLEQVLFIFLNYAFIPLYLLVSLIAVGVLLLVRVAPRFTREGIIRTL